MRQTPLPQSPEASPRPPKVCRTSSAVRPADGYLDDLGEVLDRFTGEVEPRGRVQG